MANQYNCIAHKVNGVLKESNDHSVLNHFIAKNPLVFVAVDTYRYCTLHCTGYMRSWLSSQLDTEGDTEKETSNLTCLVTVCRLLPHGSHQPSKDIHVKPIEFVTRCAIDGKFTFIDQR